MTFYISAYFVLILPMSLVILVTLRRIPYAKRVYDIISKNPNFQFQEEIDPLWVDFWYYFYKNLFKAEGKAILVLVGYDLVGLVPYLIVLMSVCYYFKYTNKLRQALV